MRLHIANCSKQNHDFIYWVPESPRTLVKPIPIGKQIAIDGTKDVLENIIAQHAKYGFVDIREIDGKTFHGLAYSLDKPIPADVIVDSIDKNDEALQLAGDEVRKAAVIATDAVAQATAQETGTRLLESEAEIIEEPRDARDTGPKMKQRLVVAPEGQTPDPAAAVRRGRGRPRKS